MGIWKTEQSLTEGHPPPQKDKLCQLPRFCPIAQMWFFILPNSAVRESLK